MQLIRDQLCMDMLVISQSWASTDTCCRQQTGALTSSSSSYISTKLFLMAASVNSAKYAVKSETSCMQTAGRHLVRCSFTVSEQFNKQTGRDLQHEQTSCAIISCQQVVNKPAS